MSELLRFCSSFFVWQSAECCFVVAMNEINVCVSHPENRPPTTSRGGGGGGGGGDEDLNIVLTIASKSLVASADEFLGEVVIPIHALSDQLKHTDWYPLTGRLRPAEGSSARSRPVTGAVQLSLL